MSRRHKRDQHGSKDQAVFCDTVGIFLPCPAQALIDWEHGTNILDFVYHSPYPLVLVCTMSGRLEYEIKF